MKRKERNKIILVFIVILLFALAYFARDNFQKKEETSGNVIKKVGMLMVLPEDETPTVATVTNMDSLLENPFFDNAMVGDRVIIYAKTGKAILFREKENKIIEVGPLNMK